MKKIFTLLAAALMSLTAGADVYKCNLAVELNGSQLSNGTKIDVTCDKNVNKYDIKLKDFTFMDIPLGDIIINDIEAMGDGDMDGVALSYDGNITLHGKLEGIEIPATLDGIIQGDVIGLRLILDLGDEQLVKVAAFSNKTQMPGSDFENWHKAGTADEPNGWHTISSGTGLAMLSPASTEISEDVREGAPGKKSAKIHSSYINMPFMGIEASANGAITTGRMHVGAIIPEAPANFTANFYGEEDGNGDPFFCTMNSYPTSISFWYKFKNGGENTHPAMVSANIIGDDVRGENDMLTPDDPDEEELYELLNKYGKFHDPATSENNNIVAEAKMELEATDTWKLATIPFNYTQFNGEPIEPAYILTTINTCSVPGGGSRVENDPDVLYVDDVVLNYEPVITGIEIFEKKVENFSADKKDYKIVLGDEIPTDDDIDIYCATGEAIAMTYYEANAKKLTVNVYNEELKFIDSYVFDTDPAGINGVTTDSNHAVTGRYTVSGQKAGKNTRGLVITKYADGTVVKSFK